MLPDPLILFPQSLFNGEAGEGSCEMAWGIPPAPSSLSAPLASPIPARHGSGTEIPSFSLCGLFLALLPPPWLRETLSCPEARSKQGRGIQLPDTFTGQLRGDLSGNTS